MMRWLCRLHLHRWLRGSCGLIAWLQCEHCHKRAPYNPFLVKLTCLLFGHVYENHQSGFSVCQCCRRFE